MFKSITILFFSLIGLIASAQQYPKVDFTQVEAHLELNPIKKNVSGNVTYTFLVNTPIDTIRIDAKKMQFQNLRINQKEVAYKVTDSQLLLFEGFSEGQNTVSFWYEAFPVQALYFIGRNYYQDVQIWSQGQGKYTSHWFPSFDNVEEKLIFNLNVSFHQKYTVIANGTLQEKETLGETICWKYKMQHPMSSYLLMLAIGRFEYESFTSKKGIENQLYIHTKDKYLFESTYRHSKAIFDFLEGEIGVDYTWEVYKQVPVWDFMYGGMENTSATIFSQEYVVDSIGFNDINYINVNAHELAHQWFGNLVTATNSTHHWLQEGFATYYALLAEEHLFGTDHFYWKLYQDAQRLEEAAQTDTIPVLNPKASTLSFYQKGAWALHAIREEIGKENFRKAVQNYLYKYAYNVADTDQFLTEIQKVCPFDVIAFKEKWLETSIFPKAEVQQLLSKNKTIRQYQDIINNPPDYQKEKRKVIQMLKKKKTPYIIKEFLLYDSQKLPFEYRKDFLQIALKSNDLKLRQTVAITTTDIPESFRADFETLLEDNSYITKEVAFFKLWEKFETQRPVYIEKFKKWENSESDNLVILYHSLNILTNKSEETLPQSLTELYNGGSVREDEQLESYKQLLMRTGTNYEATTRQKALENLLFLNIINQDVIRSLAYGVAHHRWQFAKYCREQLQKITANEVYKTTLEQQILPSLPLAEKIIVQRLLDRTTNR